MPKNPELREEVSLCPWCHNGKYGDTKDGLCPKCLKELSQEHRDLISHNE